MFCYISGLFNGTNDILSCHIIYSKNTQLGHININKNRGVSHIVGSQLNITFTWGFVTRSNTMNNSIQNTIHNIYAQLYANNYINM